MILGLQFLHSVYVYDKYSNLYLKCFIYVCVCIGNTTAASGGGGGNGVLPGWGIALIVIACVIVLVAIILAVLFVLFQKKKGKSSTY